MVKKPTYKVPIFRCSMLRDRNFIRLPVEVGAGVGCMGNFEQVAQALHFLTDDSPTELMVLFFLDGRNRLIGSEIIAKGGQHGCAVQARDILRSALVSGCSSFIIGHNHPSGDPKPSTEDLDMTAALLSAAKAIGLPFLDHVVAARGGKHCSIMGA